LVSSYTSQRSATTDEIFILLAVEETCPMSVSASRKIEGILDELRNWPSFEKLRLARMILETLEPRPETASRREGSLKDLLGVLKTEAPAPTDEECRAILDEELIKKHVK
jgi:hypothetical protein